MLGGTFSEPLAGPMQGAFRREWRAVCSAGTHKCRGRMDAQERPKKRNAADGRPAVRPKGAPQKHHDRVAALDKGVTLACALRLAAKHHGNAEPVIITLKEH